MFHSFQEFPRYVGTAFCVSMVLTRDLYSGLSHLHTVPGREGRGDSQEMQRSDQDCQEPHKWQPVRYIWSGMERHHVLAEWWLFALQDPREDVMTLERVLLQTIKFDLQVMPGILIDLRQNLYLWLQVDHPYSSLLKYAKCLKGDKPKLQKMVQMSWTFVNDSLCTTLCLQVWVSHYLTCSYYWCLVGTRGGSHCSDVPGSKAQQVWG